MTSQAYMIVNGEALEYTTYPLATPLVNDYAPSFVSSYTLAGSAPPASTTSVCCAANVNGCTVVTAATPDSPQPEATEALGWAQDGARV